MKKVFYFTILTFLCKINICSARIKSDSLLLATANFKQTIKAADTSVIDKLNSFAIYFRKKSILDTATLMANRALEMSLLLINSNNLQIKQAAKSQLAFAHNNLGSIYDEQGKYAEALKFYLTSLKLRTELNDDYGQAAALNNVGLIMAEMDNNAEALKYYHKAAELNKKINNTSFLSKNYNNIGNIYFETKNPDEALKYYTMSLELKLKLNDQKGIAMAYNNLANVFETKLNLIAADSFYNKSLFIQRQLKNQRGLCMSLANIGALRIKQKNNSEAKKMLGEAFEICQKIKDEEMLGIIYFSLAQLDSATGNFKSAFTNNKLYHAVINKLKSEEAGKKVTQMQMQYEFDQKEAMRRAEQDKKDAITNQELITERKQRNYLLGGMIIMLLLIGFIYKSYRDKKRTNKELEFKSLIIEEKQKEILASIHYAQRIQQAHLPSEGFIKKNLERLKKL